MPVLASRPHRRVRNRIAVGMAAAVTALAIGLAPTSASAVGNFNVKHTAFGCTEGDYKGSSYTYTVSGAYFAYAVTSYQYPICAPSASSVPGARAIAGSTMGAWAYSATSSVTTRIQKAFFDQVPYGHHSVGGGYLRNT
ncbi:hypothetical protein JOF42_000352 [Microbacterium phyllosphaerae]|uniref:Uncharacterized protein n=1 Tax=Microbacterium phyllosphaerae TaxID=124798 RepID=A0ABS4WKZ0_9MICO|nr:hypothetical protein [Microbacterium phyllosphaerae]MBP2376857.1 hypothetical protein [Microbacterium phyllosphaerae]